MRNEMGLTVAFARDLAKHAPWDLHYRLRVIAVSLQLARTRARQRHLHTSLGRHENKSRLFSAGGCVCATDVLVQCPSTNSLGHGESHVVRPKYIL